VVNEGSWWGGDGFGSDGVKIF